MKALISYYGGKQRIASRIVEVLSKISHTVYCEPFFGSGAVFFARKKPIITNSNYYREVINDKSKALINLYRVARENPAEFERWMRLTPYSQAEYSRAMEICQKPESYTPMELAWAYYVNINQSFAKKLSAGWGTSVYSENHAASWNNRRDRIPDCLNRLEDVHIACEDALQFIKRWDSPQTLIYADPPYPGVNQGHYDGYTLEDWQNLCDVLDNCQSSYVLSNYPQELHPKSAQQRIEIDAFCAASGKGKVKADRTRNATSDELGDRTRTEVLWVCDRSSAMRDDLIPALNGIAHASRYHQTTLF